MYGISIQQIKKQGVLFESDQCISETPDKKITVWA
jgi:hypothetical protein